MNFLEVLILIQGRGEKILAQDVNPLITDKHRYLRAQETASPWKQDLEPGAPEKRWGKGGEYWVWKRKEELPDPPAQFPEGT